MEYEYDRTRDPEYKPEEHPLDKEENQDAVLLKTLLDSVKLGGGIASDPVANESGIYFGCNDGYFYALSLDVLQVYIQDLWYDHIHTP